MRVVFDGAAKCVDPTTVEEVSINEKLLRGSNYLVNMRGVFNRFREKLIPVSADIEKMYHQVQVSEQDRDAFGFLYRPPGSQGPPLTYQMTVHVFGAILSPSTCLFAMNRAVEENRHIYPLAERIAKINFYVDNMLASFETEAEALNRETRASLKSRGFNLTKWTSSSRSVISELTPFGLASPTLDLDFDELPIERTLGMLWNSEVDAFMFRPPQVVINQEEPLTKREFLSYMSRVYGPPGFVAPIILQMKVLMQEIWGTKLDLNEELPTNYRNRLSGMLVFQNWKASAVLVAFAVER